MDEQKTTRPNDIGDSSPGISPGNDIISAQYDISTLSSADIDIHSPDGISSNTGHTESIRDITGHQQVDRDIENTESNSLTGIDSITTISKGGNNPQDIETGEPKKKKHSAAHLAQYRWKPGQSGNPNGRPKTPDEVRKKLKDSLGDAVETLVWLAAHAEKESVRYQAAQDLCDRVLGKPTQPIDLEEQGAIRIEVVPGAERITK